MRRKVASHHFEWTSSLADEAGLPLRTPRGCKDLLPVVNYWPAAFVVKRDPRWPQLMRRIGLEPAPLV